MSQPNAKQRQVVSEWLMALRLMQEQKKDIDWVALAQTIAEAVIANGARPEVAAVELFKDRTPEAAAWQFALMFAQATEWLLAIHDDGWKHLPLYLKNPLSEQAAALVYHCRDLKVQPKGLGGNNLKKLAFALQNPGFYGEQIDKREPQSRDASTDEAVGVEK